MSEVVNQTAKQIALEEYCLKVGEVQYTERTVKAASKGIEAVNDYSQKLIARMVQPLSDSVTTFVGKAKGPGRKHMAVQYLSLLSPDVAAFIALQRLMNEVSGKMVYQNVAKAIGRRIEDEVRFASFEEQNKGLYVTVQKNLDDNPDAYQDRVRRSTLKNAMNKFGLVWNQWSDDAHFHVGSKMIELTIESTGLFEINRGGEMNAKVYVVATAAVREFINSYKGQSALFRPQWQPMIAPPRPWRTPTDGGYYTERMRSNMVLTMAPGYLEELKRTDMPEVYRAVNALQATPWKINYFVLETVNEAWENGTDVKCLPSRFEIPLPPKVEYVEGDEKQLKLWQQYKRAGADVARKNRQMRSKRLAADKIVRLANDFASEQTIYFPVRCDFRGRMYFMPQYLNPQGNDLAKGLITFAESKPLGKTGVKWLAIHLCNCFGNDKIPLNERERWTRDNSDRIAATASDPWADLWWTEADKPWQFLAACAEWVGYLYDGGENYECSLPVMVDGSCNGLQHYSAMLRDEVCGPHVNLTPSEKPADIYSEVARQVEASLRADISTGGTFPPPAKGKKKSSTAPTPIAEMAKAWLESKLIGRKLTKRPTMVLPYGGTRNAFANYVKEYVVEEGNPFGRMIGRHIAYLTNHIVKALDAVVVGPRVAMKWLGEVSAVVAAEGHPISWTTPAGFVVNQRYSDMRSRRVETKVGDKVMKFTLASETAKLDKRKQARAIAPNFVHSLDSAALMLTINAMHDRGVTAFSAVHDSYGTHPCDMDTLSSCLREVFVQMYSSRDVLEDFVQEICTVLPTGTKVPPVPGKGTLDLGGILTSDFFFN